MLAIGERKGMTMQHQFCLKHGLVRLLAIVLAAPSIFIQSFTVRPQRVIWLLTFCLGTHLTSPALAADVQYVYDKLGRLVSVVAADGSSVQYTYDAVGNIQSIQKNATTALSIAEFSPSGGSAGTTVTIFGSGFDTVAANNIVKFNDAAAIVSSATANTLTVAAPASVVTGRISISNSNGNVISSKDYIVGAFAPPAITNFSPVMGVAGTQVTVSGSNFQTVKEANKTSFGNFAATVVSSSGSSLVASAPGAPLSGKITVSTPYGSAVSVNDFYGLPTGWSTNDIGYTGRLAVNGPPITLTTTLAGKKAIVLFDGVAQQRISLMSAVGTFSYSTPITIYNPDGSVLMTATMYNRDSIDLLPLPASGTYTIAIAPNANDKGSVNLSLISEAIGSITADVPFAVNLVAGQNARYFFYAEAGKAYGLALTDMTFTGSGTNPRNVTVTWEKTDGTRLYTCTLTASDSCNFSNAAALDATNNYVIRFNPSSTHALSFNAIMSKDIEAGDLVAGSAPVTMTTLQPGQNGRYTFDGVAGQSFNLVISGNTMDDGNASTSNTTYFYIYQPGDNVTEWKSSYLSTGKTNTVIYLNNLPKTGKYTVLINPTVLDKGSVNAQLLSAQEGVIAVDGATAMNLPIGQTARYTFTAEAGKTYGFAATDLVFSGSGSSDKNLYVYLKKTDGTVLRTCTFSVSNSCDFYDPQMFAVGGTYVLSFAAGSTYGVSFNAVLSKDVQAGNLSAGMPPTNLTTVLAGQNGRYTFAATAGQRFNLALSGNAIDDGSPATVNPVYVYIFKPSNTASEWTYDTIYTGTQNGVISLASLPETGTYTIWVNPTVLDKGSINLQLVSEATGTLEMDVATPISLTMGQNGRYTFTAEAGKTYGFTLANLAFTGTGGTKSVTAYLQKTDGTALTSCTFTGSESCNFYYPGWFPVAGTYVIRFITNSTYSASFNAVLSKDIDAGSLVVGSAPLTLTTVLPGQNGRFTFSATAGQSFSLVMTGNTMDDGNAATSNRNNIYIYKPSNLNSYWKMGSLNAGTANLTISLGTVPETGIYTILIDPEGADKGAISVQLK